MNVLEDLKQISDRLKKARTIRGYKSARAFANENKISESTYTQHESFKRKISISTLISYAMTLKVNPEWLLQGSGSFEINEGLDVTNMTAKKYNIYKLFDILKMTTSKIKDGEIKSEEGLYNVVNKVYENTENKDSSKALVDKNKALEKVK